MINKLFFSNGGGRLGNQLLNTAHFIAFQKEYEQKIQITSLPFWKYTHLFDTQIQHSVLSPKQGDFSFSKILWVVLKMLPNKLRPFAENYVATIIHLLYCVLPQKKSITIGKTGNYYKLIKGNHFDTGYLDNLEFATIILNSKDTAIAGWPIRCWSLFFKHEEYIRNTLKINAGTTNKSIAFINKHRMDTDMLIGVFIRLTDYRTWHNGDFYYSVETYNQWMNELTALYAEKRIKFIIACDEKIELSSFNLPSIFSTGAVPAGGHFIESITQLSLCDLIITPPSTFSIWASFMGRVPLLPLLKKNQVLSKDFILNNSMYESVHHPILSKAIY